MATTRASFASGAGVLGVAMCWWACADSAAPNAPDEIERSSDASAEVVDAPAVVIDAGAVTDAASDTLGLPDSSWCDSLSVDAAVKQLLFCADFDDGNFSRVGEAFLQWSTNASLQIADGGFQSPPSSMSVKTAPAVKKDAAAPGLDVDQSFARIGGHAEPVFRDAEVDLSFRMTSPLTAQPGTVPAELYGSDFGWFHTFLRVAPTDSGQARMQLGIASNWTGAVADGSPNEFVTYVDLATQPIDVGEWVDCRLRVSFTPLPGGDATAHVELDLRRNAVWSTVATYDHPSTRYEDHIWYIFGVTTFFTTDATSFDYDNLAVFLR